MQSFIMGALLCALAAEPTQDKSSTQNTANRAADSAQEGSRGSGAVGESRTGPPAAGIEYGEANGLAGGRTDRGPRGETGIRGDTPRHEKARSRANSQARRPNRKGSLQRPAETPP